MRRLSVAALCALFSAACATPTKQVAAEATAPGARTESVVNPRCERPCAPYLRSADHVDIVLPLRSDERASVDARSTDPGPLHAVADQLERLREPLLACGLDPRPIVVLAPRTGALSVEFRGKSLLESEAACLREVLTRGLTAQLVQREIAVGLPDQPLPTGEGSLSKDQIRSVVRQHIVEFRDCFVQHVADSTETWPFRYTVRFQVAATGEVRCIEPLNREPARSAFTCCFLPQMKRWRFPTFGGDAAFVDVNYPFMVERTPEPAQP